MLTPCQFLVRAAWLLAASAVAHAQPVPDRTAGPAQVAPRPSWRLEGGIIVGIPGADLDEEYRSVGFGLAVGGSIRRHLSVSLGYRDIVISTTRKFLGDPGELYLHHRDVNLGLRYARPLLPDLSRFQLDAFGEAHVALARLGVWHPEFAGGRETGTIWKRGRGAGLRGGVIATFRSLVGVGAAIGYSRTTILHVNGTVPGYPAVNASGSLSMVASWLTYEVFAHVAF